MATNTRSPVRVVWSSARKFYATRNLCMHDFLKLHHNCDAFMGVQKERKISFLTAFEHWEKEAHSLFAAKY